ncbi:MAG: MarR family winged helix-turn-helix transcriptional regulator [Ktedonobacteraceae bacterium]
MEQTTLTTEHKLFRALSLFKRLSWHEHSIGGCKPSEIRVLFCIKRNMNQQISEMKVSEISKQLHVTSPTITQLLNSLEANGLIERHIDGMDRRVVGVTLTEKGEMITQRATEAMTGAMGELITYLGEEQSDQLADLLFKVFRYFDEKETSMSHSQWTGDEYV